MDLSLKKMMLTIIALPSNFVASTTATMSDFFGDLSPITILVVGVLLGVVAFEIIINAIRHR